MHLKRLEAFGFKSFADRVVFDFEPGFTCFVGPNGCGKSNVVDAVKWVLGEQSAKSLRGGEMLDVIFNGSGHRKPLNFAEVTLIFDNSTGKLPLAAPEVSVSRRLYRTGESEYLINKAICRLKDVRELFWDTGIGTSSYSVIEQGRIAALLEANSKDRRILFEEAAGIHKYKERKRIALRKLERVEQNLARLNDLLGEVERNLKMVTRQAEKARKAKELTDKLREQRLDILLADAFTSQQALQEVTSSLMLAQERVAALGNELTEMQQITQVQQTRMAEIDERLTVAQRELSEAQGRLHRLEAETEAERRSIEELSEEAERARLASKAAGERAAAIAQERERVELDAQRASENLTERAAKSAELQEAVATEASTREGVLKALDNARREALDALGRRSQLQDTLVRAEAELNGLEYRVRRSQAQMTKAEDQLRFAQAESEETRARMTQVASRRETLETEQLGLRALQQRTEGEIDRLTRTAQDLQRELENRRSRLTALEGLRESGEGLSQGARTVLTTLRRELNLNGEVVGLVADCLGVDPRLEHAIEASLGTHIETIVVRNENAARVLGAQLSEREAGRATFLIVRDTQPSQAADLSTLPAGCLGRAADLIACDDSLRSVAQSLLGDVIVFDTQENACAARTADTDGRWNCVSLSGEMFGRNGTLAAGRYKPQRLGLIGRKNEIARLGVQMDELRVRIEELGERTGFLEKRAQQIASDEERLRVDLSALALSYAEMKSMLAAIEREESRSTEEKKLAVQEIHELEAERAAHIERVGEMRTELDAFRKVENDCTALVQSVEAELTQLESALRTQREQLADNEREVATWRERATSLEREGQSLSAQFAERRDESDREARRAEALQERCTSLMSTLADKDRLRGEFSASIETLSAQTSALNQEKEACRVTYDEARGREREASVEQQRAREELSEVQEREVNLRVRLESKVEQVRSDFQLDAVAELTSRGRPPEVPAQALEAVRDMEEKLARLGPVNMYALDELVELEKRHGFLKVQFEDLDSARASLRDVIARINRRSRNLFQETFDAVKLHFNEIFRKLFGGGKADLLLEEGEDILEAGIEIMARPPGKEPRSVMLLSGGEKTMTMIALLFAVFRSRPAPFCILDEVDAPLDEANVDRFNVIVREFMDKSQFVVITHNRKTMSYADILYGITMPEPGVSKRIAIKFSEIERHLPMDELNKAAERARQSMQAIADKPVETEVKSAESKVDSQETATNAESNVSVVQEEMVAGE